MPETSKLNVVPKALTYDDLGAVSPALEVYTKSTLFDDRWKRPGLSPRDRSIVTVAALISRMQTIEKSFHFALALDNGVKPGELSEIITHLAFYSGWPNTMCAVAIVKNVFYQRGIGIEQMRARSPVAENVSQITAWRAHVRPSAVSVWGQSHHSRHFTHVVFVGLRP